MSIPRRSFILGAGASRAEGYPVTTELMYGLSHELVASKHAKDYQHLTEYLGRVYGVTREEFEDGASYWKYILGSRAGPYPGPTGPRDRLPDITEVLSIVDALLSDDGRMSRPFDESARALDGRELDRTRHQVVWALARAFRELNLMGQSAGRLARMFVERLHSTDVVVTTNWDILLDIALDQLVQPTLPVDYGTDALIVDLTGEALSDGAGSGRKPRPALLKLHGSFNWLYCQRCTRLYVNPAVIITPLAYKQPTRSKDASDCECGMGLSPLLVTPTYLKNYRNRHLANVWARSLQELARCEEWIFIGYSLPPDDVHIKAMLLKAHRIRVEAGLETRVYVVNLEKSVLIQFQRLFRTSEFASDGFERYVLSMPS